MLQLKNFSYTELGWSTKYPISLCFAIMEIEAWFIGLETLFLTVDKTMTPKEIEDKTNINITLDPETSFFHPYITLCRILDLKGIKYNKHESDISSLISKLSKTDYEILLESDKCKSFKNFIGILLP